MNWFKLIPEEKIIEWRRHLHQNPELSFKEFKTSDYLVKTLETFGNIEVTRPTPTAVIGTLKGAKAGKTAMLRGDIDALPVQEATGLSYASVNPGISHACGHDAHAAMVLGAACVLSQMQDQLAGTVKFLFQPAEEKDPGGAASIVESGALNDIDAAFACHIISQTITGSVGIVPTGAVTTSADCFFLTIQGKGTHGSMPQFGIDPILIGAEIVTALHSIVPRNITPGEMAVVSVGEFKAGDTYNIIPDTVYISGTVRSVTTISRDIIKGRIYQIIEGICNANNATYDLQYNKSYSAVINDETLAQLVKKSAIDVLGENLVYKSEQLTASEDFSAYRRLAPSCFYTLGGGTAEEGCEYANHSPRFKIVESAMINGVKTHVSTLLNFLKS